MPRDQRLYMTFPNDIHRHPKVARLDVAVKWAFVEMNGEARIADNDGVFSADDAEFTWGREILDALVSSHPSRPLVMRVGDTYVIRDYAEHQQTKAEREELSRKRSEAGAKGAQQRTANRQASAKQVLSKPEQTQAESESESEDYYLRLQSQSLDNRAREVTDEPSEADFKSTIADQYGVDVRRVRAHIIDKLGITLTPTNTVALSVWILNKPKTIPHSPTKYVLGAVTRSPAEIQQHIYEAALV